MSNLQNLFLLEAVSSSKPVAHQNRYPIYSYEILIRKFDGESFLKHKLLGHVWGTPFDIHTYRREQTLDQYQLVVKTVWPIFYQATMHGPLEEAIDKSLKQLPEDAVLYSYHSTILNLLKQFNRKIYRMET